MTWGNHGSLAARWLLDSVQREVRQTQAALSAHIHEMQDELAHSSRVPHSPLSHPLAKSPAQLQGGHLGTLAQVSSPRQAEHLALSLWE
jgi:hypothetical protein